MQGGTAKKPEIESNPMKGNVGPLVGSRFSIENRLLPPLFLRSSSDGQASIYIRITEGRGDQFKFATGHAILHPDHWNKTKQRVRNKVDAVGMEFEQEAIRDRRDGL